MSKQMSTLHKALAFSQLYATLARLVGYGWLNLRDQPAKVGPICELYGRGATMGALDEIAPLDEKEGVRRLTPEARRLSRFLLGPEPGTPEYEARHGKKTEGATAPSVLKKRGGGKRGAKVQSDCKSG